MGNTRPGSSLSSGVAKKAKTEPADDGEISGADREIEVDDNADEDEDTGEEEDLEEEDDAGPGKDDNGPMYHPRGSRKAVPAVYHSSIRAELLAAAAQLGQYDFPQPRGAAKYDTTSFLPSQKSWGPSRANYPPIIFHYKPLNGRHPNYEPQQWFHRGRLVIDRDDRPILRWRDIPDVLSSKLPGYVMEAIHRIDSRIRHSDLMARMPDKIKRSNVISARMSRFRDQAGCLCWHNRAGNDAMSTFLERHLPEHLKRANTTLGFRDLEKYEIVDLRLANLGKHGERSRYKDPALTSKYISDTQARARRLRAQAGIASQSDDDLNSESDPYERRDLGSVHSEDAEGESDSLDAARFMDHAQVNQAPAHPPLPVRYFEFNVHDPEDCRNHYPQSARDQAHIEVALQATYQHFYELTTSEPPLADPAYSYTAQWQHLQDQIDESFGHADGYLVPLLVAVGKWVGGIENWRSSPYVHENEYH